MASRRQGILGLLGLFAGLLALPGHAGDVLGKAGALLWEMGDTYWDFGNRHIARSMTPEKVAALAEKAAGKLAARRSDLLDLLRELDPETRFAVELRQFLERWPDRKAYRDDLLRFGEGEELGLALSGLKGQVRDTRTRWQTPFPFFRP